MQSPTKSTAQEQADVILNNKSVNYKNTGASGELNKQK